MIQITAYDNPEFTKRTEKIKYPPEKAVCQSCRGPGEYMITVENDTIYSKTVLCRKCLRELAARSTRASRLYAAEEKTSFA